MMRKKFLCVPAVLPFFCISVSAVRQQQAEELATADAIELCGPPDASALEILDRDCPAINGSVKAEPALTVTATSRQLNYRRYKLPELRLYICHPHARRLGFLVSTLGVEEIKSTEHMAEVASKLLKNKLWNSEQSTFGKAYAKYKVWKGTRTDTNRALLWVLDRDGNLVIAPELQGIVEKHGDLTPGSSPVDRPDLGDAQLVSPVCCCSRMTGDENTCKYITVAEASLKYCCKLRVGGCPSFTRYSRMDGRCGELRPELFERRVSGHYRGVARAGGEIRFPDGQGSPWVHDKSGYSLSRVEPESLKEEGGSSDGAKKMKAASKTAPLGTCAMSRLRSYWSSLGWPVAGLTFDAVSFPEGREVMTPA
eukprot:TRINITY_DN36718_c0_g1_i1.p1 TRINITY_DN36718_c0_g1~~TRINITY_DN36718_c0_g1_i1.p1  ORF type:complete len:367 (-),score=57.81 TRINITY_DN36718_c0_g1_i1:9-1109(-)